MNASGLVNKVWHTISRKFRKKREKAFFAMFPGEKLPTMIDVGGLANHWDNVDDRNITILNLMPQESRLHRVVVGHGRKMDFPDGAFNLAYSVSAIEHCGRWADQQTFALEMRRIGKALYCQTPNRWFPLEVHYMELFWHWYPKLLRNYFIVRYLTLWGWLVRPSRARVLEYADATSLLSYKQMQELFPDCELKRERFLGLTKSLIAVGSTQAQTSGGKAVSEKEYI